MQYAKDSLKIYKSFRQKALNVVAELKARDISQAYLDGNDEVMDILRLTCIEGGISLSPSPGKVLLKFEEQEYKILFKSV
jgi:hypothetical protein